MPDGIEDFAGRWQLSKVITDRRGPEARFAGEAQVSGQGAKWLYTETGTLTFAGGAALQAERRYLWSPVAGGVDISFDDGRAFHHLPYAGGGASHDCPPDLYDVTYDFSDWPLGWTAHWHVTGPRKDYDMACRYLR